MKKTLKTHKSGTVENIRISTMIAIHPSLVNSYTKERLLVPSGPNPIYEIYVEHRIDGEPFLHGTGKDPV